MQLAFDRSARSFSPEGHLSVRSVVSRACVSDYRTEEIPGWQELALEPGRTYAFYRDPREIAKGAASLHGKPLLMRHQAINAEDHPRELVVGSVADPEFKDGDLTADLTIWDGDAIARIEDESQRSLSCGYFWKPQMGSGVTPENERFDGRMTAIVYNHVTLCDLPRVDGAMVADSAAGWQLVADALQSFKVKQEKKRMPNNGLRDFAAKFKKLSGCAADDEQSPGERLAAILKSKLTPEELSEVTELLQLAAEAVPEADPRDEFEETEESPEHETKSGFLKARTPDPERKVGAMDELIPNMKRIGSSEAVFTVGVDGSPRNRPHVPRAPLSAAQKAALYHLIPNAKRVA